ncbi:MAG: DNA polymerase III subunit alpha [Chlamydiae bacterium]|nr:DNA polymerase III subunit alpha [Chlamydiota bacterium]
MYIPLHVQSQYSILDATGSIEQLVQKAQEFECKGMALTDRGNLFGAVEFYKTCTVMEMAPIIGSQIHLAFGSANEKKRNVRYPNSAPILLLAKDKTGYHNLCKLSSLGYLEGFYYVPRNDKKQLEQYKEGLICIAGFQGSYLGYFGLNEQQNFEKEVLFFQEVFQEDFYLNLERQQPYEHVEQIEEPYLKRRFYEHIENQQKLEGVVKEVAHTLKIPLVATNPIKYLREDDHKAHEILINVQSKEPCQLFEYDSLGHIKAKIPNPKRAVESTHELYFKSPEEMKQAFSDIPEALENSFQILEKCTFKMDLKTRHYPVYFPEGVDKNCPKKERREKATQFLKDLCLKNIPNRYTEEKKAILREKFPDKEPLDLVNKRLEYELGIVIGKGLADYLLIVYDFIHWAKTQKIPIGPGRGSGASSIILYLIGITDIEPLSLQLFFERFINPERPSFPDIDVDICMERRQEVIEYTQKKYGKDNVAQIITFGKMKAKMAIRDVGRVLNIPLAKVNIIAKLVPDDIGITLTKACTVEPELARLYDEDEDTRELIDYAKALEGCVRNTGIHAAGVIICEDPIYEHIPVCVSKDAQMSVTQYSMKPVEDVGMLKIDFLGLKTLTTLQITVDLINKRYQKQFDWSNLPMSDQKTFDLLNEGKTLGIFQLEGGGMQELAKQLHFDRFEEIIAANALYRPGPMEMIPTFIARKHKREKIEYEHPLMESILAETYGIMVYQEQVIQIASKLAGYTLGEGDMLRRAMGKKDKKEMGRQRKKFIKGAIANEIEETVATNIFDKIERFASYGFPKSHAAAYSYISYATAFFKANYPGEWMAALMTCDYGDTSKVAKYIAECATLNIKILPPDINFTDTQFIPTDEGIRFAMMAIKGMGTAVVDKIVKERNKNGLFQSLYDFLYRMDPKQTGRKAIELLVDSGAFDFTTWSRDELRAAIEPLANQAEQKIQEKKKGIMTMFSLMEDEDKMFEKKPKVTKRSTKLEILQREKELLGFFLTGHPLEDYKEQLEKLECMPLEIVMREEFRAYKTAFVIESIKIKISKAQRKFAILSISDGLMRQELPIWPEMYEQSEGCLREGTLVFAILTKDDQSRLQCRYLSALDQLTEEKIETAYQSCLRQRKKTINKGAKMERPTQSIVEIELEISAIYLSNILDIKKVFRKFPGGSHVRIHYIYKGEKLSMLEITDPWGVEVNDEFLENLSKLKGIKKVQMIDFANQL